MIWIAEHCRDAAKDTFLDGWAGRRKLLSLSAILCDVVS